MESSSLEQPAFPNLASSTRHASLIARDFLLTPRPFLTICFICPYGHANDIFPNIMGTEEHCTEAYPKLEIEDFPNLVDTYSEIAPPFWNAFSNGIVRIVNSVKMTVSLKRVLLYAIKPYPNCFKKGSASFSTTLLIFYCSYFIFKSCLIFFSSGERSCFSYYKSSYSRGPFSSFEQHEKHFFSHPTQNKVYGNAFSMGVLAIGCKASTKIFAISTYKKWELVIVLT